MEIVGIKKLKTHLSQYIAKVRQGERVIVTDYGVEVAELVPLSEERQAMERLAKAGRLQWDGGKPAGLSGVKAQGQPVSETVLDERR